MDQCELIGQAAGLSKVSQSSNFYIGVNSKTNDVSVVQLPGSDLQGYMKQTDAFESCMEARGYQRAASQPYFADESDFPSYNRTW